MIFHRNKYTVHPFRGQEKTSMDGSKERKFSLDEKIKMFTFLPTGLRKNQSSVLAETPYQSLRRLLIPSFKFGWGRG
jgi:hypothetical protein